MIRLLIPCIISYIIGSIPFSFIIGKFIKGIDIRAHGSGNVGATNLLRVTGKVPGVTALVLDAAKGVICVSLIANIFYSSSLLISLPMMRVLLGLCVVFGHIWTVFLKFKGGKGVATTIGVFLGVAPLVTILSLIIWSLTFYFTRFVSLSSIAFLISLPIFVIILKRPDAYFFLSGVLCIFIVIKHIPNIKRLLEGKEHKIGEKIKK